MTTSKRSVSVIIPTYNDPEFLDQSITSVLSQTDTDASVEVIIVDSSDDDRVKRIAEGYGSDVRYSWIEPDGVASARNHGLDLATGDIVGFCDADDYWHTEKLAHQLPELVDGTDIVYSDEYLVDNETTYRLSSLPVRSPETHHVNYFRNGGVGSRSVLARTECFDAERFDERFQLREDPHLWTRLFAQFRPARVDEALSYKRRRTGSITDDIDLAYEMKMLEISDLVKRYPELEPYRKEREMQAKHEYGKRLLSDTNRVAEARTHLRDVLQSDHYNQRTVLLYMITLLPRGNRTVVRTIQHGKWRFSKIKEILQH
ncbi:glycosyltransferase family 2 protein [Halalkalicoccus sp. NIPERK01]|uniref:glycosyltransferase family 2 protein n=1 Tax=Halalkalicoccus sp. NIPERK01 TaxID=3053469 RepID=UPI00256EBB34|nr:glycosyltransferase family 2 protein [Halalkalicoccus sp. NIPERK01]MDL5363432.1 glycosyltransferase family 2 protein [Halalkalicoccus sp. NIPERK01]